MWDSANRSVRSVNESDISLVAIEAVSWQGLGVTPWLEGKPDSEWKGFSEAEWKIRVCFAVLACYMGS